MIYCEGDFISVTRTSKGRLETLWWERNLSPLVTSKTKNKQKKCYSILADAYEIFSGRDIMSHRALKKESRSHWMMH